MKYNNAVQKSKNDNDIYISELKRLLPSNNPYFYRYIIYVSKTIEGDIVYLFFSKLGLLIKEGEFENYSMTRFFDICYDSDDSIYIYCPLWRILMANLRRKSESHSYEEFKKIISKSQLLNDVLIEAESIALENERLKEEYNKKIDWQEEKLACSYLQAQREMNYFKYFFWWYQRTQKKFCDYLLEINELLKKEHNNDYSNLVMFTEGNPNTNWVSYRGSLFDIFNKMYEEGLTSIKAIKYIKECNLLHKEIINSDYELDKEYKITNRKSKIDGRVKTFIICRIKPTKLKTKYEYWFEITSGSLIININHIDINAFGDIEIEAKYEDAIIDDCLSLFECSSNSSFYKKIFFDAIKELKSKNIIHYGMSRNLTQGEERSFCSFEAAGKHKIKKK